MSLATSANETKTDMVTAFSYVRRSTNHGLMQCSKQRLIGGGS
jgi:hypothetical protein